MLVNKESLKDSPLLTLILAGLSLLLSHWPRLTVLIVAYDLAQHWVSVNNRGWLRPHHTDLTGITLTFDKAAHQPPPVLVSDRGLTPALGCEGLGQGQRPEGAEAQGDEDHGVGAQAALLCPHREADWLLTQDTRHPTLDTDGEYTMELRNFMSMHAIYEPRWGQGHGNGGKL